MRVVACTIRNMGNWAVKVHGGAGHGVVGCDIYQTGQGGVHLEGGDRKTLTPASHYADNNHIHHTARWDPVYQQAITVFGVGNRATHNLIHDVPHVAIGFTGNDQTIEYNEIHSAVFQSNDAGAIYTSPPDETWSMRGHKIRYPELLGILEDEPLAPKGNVMARNVCWDGKWGWMEPKAVPCVKFEANLIDVDPRFAGKPPADFSLAKDSPAWKLGFCPIPRDKMGVYQSDDRASWPVEHTVRSAPTTSMSVPPE